MIKLYVTGPNCCHWGYFEFHAYADSKTELEEAFPGETVHKIYRSGIGPADFWVEIEEYDAIEEGQTKAGGELEVKARNQVLSKREEVAARLKAQGFSITFHDFCF